MTLVRRAEAFARGAHEGQRYGSRPFTDHLAAVHDVLIEFGFNNANLLAAAWLHDVLEDTADDAESLRGTGIPADVIAIVVAVTDDKGLPTRAERKAATYAKIAAQGPFAVVLKLADRIANVRACMGSEPSLEKLWMYRAEEVPFVNALHAVYQSPLVLAMWGELGRLLAAAAPVMIMEVCDAADVG